MNSLRTTLIVAITVLLVGVLADTALCQEAEPLWFEIERRQDILLGDQVQVAVSVHNPNTTRGIERIELLIEYPTEALTFDGASEGQLFTDCDWVLFDYSLEDSNLIHLIAVADWAGDEHDPNCYFENAEGALAQFSFTVTDDPSYDCTFVPIRFYWKACDDNYIWLTDYVNYFVSNEVYNWIEPIPVVDTLPNYSGIPDSCLDELPGPNPIRLVDFFNYGIDIICSDSIDCCGDINLNDMPYEIADFVLLFNYFLYGFDVFEINFEAQVAASDVNNDGDILSFRDLVYIWRVIIGDALPYPKGPVPGDINAPVFEHNIDAGTVDVYYYAEDGLAGAWLIFDDSVTPSIAVPGGVESWGYQYGGGGTWWDYTIDSNTTRVVIITDPDKEIRSGPLLTLEGPGVLDRVYTTDFHNAKMFPEILLSYGEVDIDFAVGLIGHIFAGGPIPEPGELADADCSGYVDIDDVVWVIGYIFQGGPPPGDC
jgi:hypothetical protein